jgi:hypothetical protein
MSGGGGKGGAKPATQTQNVDMTNTASNTYDPWVGAAGQSVYNRQSALADQFGPMGPSALTQQAANAASGALGQYYDPANAGAFGALSNDRGGGAAQSAIEQLMRMYGGSGGADVYGAGGNYNGGGAGGPGIRDTNWRDFTDFNIGDYSNPYTNSVVNDTLGDIDRGSAQAANARAAAASQAGAFGGSRHGILDAVAAGETASARGQASNQLRAQAYEAARQAIGMDQQGGFQSQAANQNADINAAQIAAQRAASESAAGASRYATDRSTQLGALSSALQGGLGLGTLDIGRGTALAGFGQGLLGNVSSLGGYLDQLGRADRGDQFDAYSQLGATLGGLPLNNQQTSRQQGTVTGQAQQAQGSRGSGALGGALSGAASGTAIMPGWGTAIGAGLGLLGGMKG